jgi:hypothetical protein
MKAINLMGSVLQRFNTPVSSNNHVGRSARTTLGSHAPSELSLRTGRADMPPRARSLPPALPTPSPTAERQRLQAEVQKVTDQVGWLSSLRKDVEDQTARVRDRLTRAEQEWENKELANRQLGGKQPAAAAASASAELRQIKEQVALLSWRYDQLGERQQAVAQMLEEARNDLVEAKGALARIPPPTQNPPTRPLALAIPRATSPLASPVATPAATPFATPTPTPTASAHSSPASSRPMSRQSSSASAISTETDAAQQPQSPAGLTHRARELEQIAQELNDELDVLEGPAQMVDTLLEHAQSQVDTAEADMLEAILTQDRGLRARLDTQSAKAHAVMRSLEQSKEGFDRLLAPLTAQFDRVEHALETTRRQLAAAERTVGETSNAHHLPSTLPTGSPARPLDDAGLLKAALPDGGAALARLADRSARSSPRTVKDRLRATIQGRPRPMEGPRQDAFIQLVEADVMAVARQGTLRLSDAVDLMRTSVTDGNLGASLSQNDKDELLAALNVVQVDRAQQE